MSPLSTAELLEAQEVEKTPPPPTLLPITELKMPEPGGPDELLKHRYLCRKGGMLLVGSTGIGKSTFAVQAMIHWAIGRSFLGIEPNGNLRSVMIQAENDEGDLAEMVEGVTRGPELTPTERTLVGENVKVGCESARSGLAFIEQVVRPICAEFNPDLLWIDPALSYIGGDSNSQEAVGTFLRNGLQPLLQEYDCGCILVHHTNKPTKSGTKDTWKAGDFAYLGAGSAEWANWSRAVLAIQNAGSNRAFKIHAGKRGGRLRWVDEFDIPQFEKWIGHCQGSLRWEELNENEVQEILAVEAPQSTARTLTLDDVRPHMKPKTPISDAELVDGLRHCGFSRDRAKRGIMDLVDSGELFLVGRKRSGSKPQHCYALADYLPDGYVELTGTGGAAG
jgi:hypothetical protein